MSYVKNWARTESAGAILAVTVAIAIGVTGCGGVVDPTSQLRLNDVIAPVISLETPVDGAAYLPLLEVRGSVTDAADGAGAPGSVSSLTYEIVGATVGDSVAAGTDGTFAFEIDTTSLTGTVTLRVSAIDWNDNPAQLSVELVPPKEMISFAFLAADNVGVAVDAVGAIEGTTITVVVPAAAPKASLVATFEYYGTSVEVNGTPQASGVTVNDFSSDTTYRVIANDGTYTDYSVIVSSVDDKDLLTFWFRASDNGGLGADVQGVVGSDTVTVTVPYATNLTGLVAEFTASGEAVLVGSTHQVSGTTANDFSSPVIYTVRAQDATTHDYTVTVTPELNPAKELTSFEFPSVSAVGAVDSTGHEISIAVPLGTNLTNLIATFVTTGTSVDIGGTPQVSGTTANDFSATVTYTVVAENSTTQDYAVYVHIAVSMKTVPAVGNFSMGYDIDGVPDNGEGSEPVHTVASISAFEMGTYEVTHSQWSTVEPWAADHGYTFERSDIAGEGPQEPVGNVSWYDALVWLNALSEKEGLTPVYYTNSSHTAIYRGGSTPDLLNANVDWSANGYRLPTEAEWELAARYIDGSSWVNGDVHSGYNLNADVYACGRIDTSSTVAVGSLQANSLAISDMTGNVREWCWDRYGTYTTGSPYTDANPHGPDTGTTRINRGGGAWDSPDDGDTSFRRQLAPSQSGAWSGSSRYGLRAVRN